jgi:hypothetical protein
MYAGTLVSEDAAAIRPICPMEAPSSLANNMIRREVEPFAIPAGMYE